MISSKALLTDLKKQLKLLQVDLRERAEAPDDRWGQRLKEQHRTALERGRTAHPWVTWRDGEVDQAAVAWLVATTFVRFCEDNDLLEGARDELGQSRRHTVACRPRTALGPVGRARDRVLRPPAVCGPARLDARSLLGPGRPAGWTGAGGPTPLAGVESADQRRGSGPGWSPSGAPPTPTGG